MAARESRHRFPSFWRGTIVRNFANNKLTMEKIRLNIQLAIAVVVFLTGIGLLIAGFILPPAGEIHNSVLVAFGEACTFCGAIIGVDYRYKFKAFIEERRPHSQQEQNNETLHDE